MRVVPANQTTGGIDPDEVVKYVDKDTCVLSIMSASNISGNIMDIAAIGIEGFDFTECVAEYQRRGVTVYEHVNTSIY